MTNGTPQSVSRHSPFEKIEAIASGVRARLDESTSFSRRVTDETVKTARALGIADSIIERWSAERLARLAHETERLRELRSLLSLAYPKGLTSRQVKFPAVQS